MVKKKATTKTTKIPANNRYTKNNPFQITVRILDDDKEVTAWIDPKLPDTIIVKISCQEYGINEWLEKGRGIIATHLTSAGDEFEKEDFIQLMYGTDEEMLARIATLVREKRKVLDKADKKMVDELYRDLVYLLDFITRMFTTIE